MKVSVYDSKNRDRLLGTLSGVGALENEGDTIRLPLRSVISPTPWEPVARSAPHTSITFQGATRTHVTQKAIDALTTETTEWARKCFVTQAPLVELMKLKEFTVAGGTLDPYPSRYSYPAGY